MATFTTTVTQRENPRNAAQVDTIGSTFVRNVLLSIPASVGANDTSVVTGLKLPAGCMITDIYIKSSANGAANSAVTLTSTTDNLVIFGSANANNVTDSWSAPTLNRANCVSTVDQTVTLACSGANAVNASAWTMQMVLVGVSCGDAMPYLSTFTI